MFERAPTLIGVVHLAALPGAPRHREAMAAILARAADDARRYERAGFDAVIVENFGDAPFYPRRVPPETVAALTVAARAVKEAVKLPVGVNCLRNDGVSAIAIAAAAELDFIRVNVLTGAAVADQGLLEGEAHEVLRARARLRPGVLLFADVGVKHAASLGARPLEEEARDALSRGLADALLVSGSRTGSPPDGERVWQLRAALGPKTRLLIGSGLAPDNAAELLRVADGAIVGTSVKERRETSGRVDEKAAAALVSAARRAPSAEPRGSKGRRSSPDRKP